MMLKKQENELLKKCVDDAVSQGLKEFTSNHSDKISLIYKITFTNNSPSDYLALKSKLSSWLENIALNLTQDDVLNEVCLGLSEDMVDERKYKERIIVNYLAKILSDKLLLAYYKISNVKDIFLNEFK
ncbi:hypothetical protein ACSW8S_16650 (plasmid) [Clostridium perfringens]